MPTLEFPCPSCRRLSVVDLDAREAAHCSRCGCELALLTRLREFAGVHARLAAAALESGSASEAADHAAKSWSVKPGVTAAACGFLAGVMKGDSADTDRWRRRLEAATAD